MFIVTTKFSKKRALLVVIALAVLLTGVILLAGRRDRTLDRPGEYQISSERDIVAFLEHLGWQVLPDPIEVLEVVIPREFSDVFEAYNQIQIATGFDLSEHHGVSAVRYTYQVLNYPGQADGVVADVLVAGGVVIGGDIQSIQMDGFLHGLTAHPDRIG